MSAGSPMVERCGVDTAQVIAGMNLSLALMEQAMILSLELKLDRVTL